MQNNFALQTQNLFCFAVIFVPNLFCLGVIEIDNVFLGMRPILLANLVGFDKFVTFM